MVHVHSKPDYVCIHCGTDWPQHFLKCPGGDCHAGMEFRVHYRVTEYAANTLRAAVAQALSKAAPLTDLQPDRERVTITVARAFAKLYFPESPNADGPIYAIATDGTAWVLAETWMKLEPLPND